MQGNLMSRRNFVGAAAATAATVAAFSLTGCGSNGSSDAKSDAKEDKAETVYEISDLAYHVLVLMVQAGITVEDVTRELEKRHVIDHKVKQERMQ